MRNLKEFHDHHVAFVKELYQKAVDGKDYDMVPFLAMERADENDMIMVMLAGPGNPMDMAGAAVMMAQPDMICFASSIWRKDPEAPSVRVGEGVMVLSETRREQLSTIFDVTRDPYPVLSEGQPGDLASPRVPLLYQPNHTEH